VSFCRLARCPFPSAPPSPSPHRPRGISLLESPRSLSSASFYPRFATAALSRAPHRPSFCILCHFAPPLVCVCRSLPCCPYPLPSASLHRLGPLPLSLVPCVFCFGLSCSLPLLTLSLTLSHSLSLSLRCFASVSRAKTPLRTIDERDSLLENGSGKKWVFARSARNRGYRNDKGSARARRVSLRETRLNYCRAEFDDGILNWKESFREDSKLRIRDPTN